MNKQPLIIGGILLLIVIVGYTMSSSSSSSVTDKAAVPSSPSSPVGQVAGAISPKHATYMIDGIATTLIDGVATTSARPDSSSILTTRYFGNEALMDLNGDSREDVIFLLTQEGGGSGNFYYVVAALNTETGYIGSHALFLGDRIAPQTTEVSMNPAHKGVFVINYADRAKGEPMTAKPSVGVSRYFKLDVNTMQIGEVAQDFEGEADPSRMTLEMTDWKWEQTVNANGVVVTPKKPGVFSLSFKAGSVSVKTDCNSMGGTYVADDGSLSFGNMMSTMMYCEGSQETEFSAMLGEVVGYRFTSKGELILSKQGGGTMTFR
jgi:heat shock protein HslJ